MILPHQHVGPYYLRPFLHLVQGGLHSVTVFIEHLLHKTEPTLLSDQLAIFLWSNRGEVGQGPDSPQLALRCVAYSSQADDGGEGSVVDVPAGLQVPPVDGPGHAVQHMIPGNYMSTDESVT